MLGIRIKGKFHHLENKSLSFICEKGDYTEDVLKQFTINTGTIVIIKGYATVENGKLNLHN